jgi:hypothetical protein
MESDRKIDTKIAPGRLTLKQEGTHKLQNEIELLFVPAVVFFQLFDLVCL